MRRIAYPMLTGLLLAACDPTDPCEDAALFTPSVTLGVGERDFEPLEDNQFLEQERGMQGGSHIWLSASTTGIAPGRRQYRSAKHEPPSYLMTLLTDDGLEAGRGTSYGPPKGNAEYAEMTGMRVFPGYFEEGEIETDEEGNLPLLLTIEVEDACGNVVTDERRVRI